MLVCGIDPGLERTGYGVVRASPDGVRVVDAGVISSDAKGELSHRLVELAEGMDQVLAEHRPAIVAVEELFAHYKHPRTAILMGHARGVLLEAAARHGVAARSYSATHIKRSLTGNGRASKQQVQRVICRTLGLPAPPEPPDVADALAVALCAVEDAARERRACRESRAD